VEIETLFNGRIHDGYYVSFENEAGASYTDYLYIEEACERGAMCRRGMLTAMTVEHTVQWEDGIARVESEVFLTNDRFNRYIAAGTVITTVEPDGDYLNIEAVFAGRTDIYLGGSSLYVGSDGSDGSDAEAMSATNVLMAGIGGAIIGATLGGPAGAVVGGVVGAAAGAAAEAIDDSGSGDDGTTEEGDGDGDGDSGDSGDGGDGGDTSG
jgi:hypothetical protein